uniref:CSON009770 protein n=1 Tax=Culicoides sonorensis TaxID=179676 RepID=A0A336LF04_CULSO
MEYYAIHVPKKTEEETETVNVFTTRDDALKLLKSHKDARFKAFQGKNEAEEFSRYGTLSSNINITGLKSPSSLPIAAEKSLHRSLKPQELVAFRKEIEQNNLSNVYRMVMENPRYLVTAANTPTILKEGTRYNPLHVAIISKHLNMCKLILLTIEKPQFIELCNGPSLDSQSTQEASMILLESYLNMPDKPRSETPLHFAAKLGLKDIIELLISYPICKMKPNSEGLLPKDIICQRVTATPELHKEIENLLQEHFYVPIWRASDNTVPPVIGEPFSTTEPPKLEGDKKHGPQMEIKAYAGPMDKEQAQVFKKRLKTPPRLIPSTSAQSPISCNNYQSNFSSPYKRSPIPAASPLLSPTKFKHNLLNNNYASTPVSMGRGRKLFTEKLDLNDSDESSDTTPTSEKNQDYQNGNTIHTEIETENKVNGQKLDACTPKKNFHAVDRFFNEYREDKHNDSSLIDTSLPINQSFNYICEETSNVYDPFNVFKSPPVQERLLRITDPDKGVETIGRELAKTQNIGWKEYWKFLDKFVDLSSKEGLEMFEDYLKKRENMPDSTKPFNVPSNTVNADDSIFALCAGLNTLNINKEDVNTPKMKSLNHTIKMLQERRTPQQIASETTKNNHIATPYLHIEKALQVYAKRFSRIESPTEVFPILEQEMRKMEDLIFSFINDQRFMAVQLKKSHSRYGHLIYWYLQNDSAKVGSKKIRDVIKALEKESGKSKQEIKCIVKFLSNGEKENISSPHALNTEEECIEAWKRESECGCSFIEPEASDEKLKEMRRKRRKLRLGLWQSNETNDRPFVPQDQLWKARTGSNSVDEHDSGSSLDDDEIYYSCDSDIDFEFIGTDDEMDHDSCFITPPESPTDFESVYENSDDWLDEDFDFSFENYIEGHSPSKADIDAFRAISNITISENEYPHLFKWKNALQHLKNRFPDSSSYSSSVLLKAKNAF